MIDTETTDAVMTNIEIKQRRTGMTDGMGRVLIKGSGDLASGIALRLHRAGFRILMTDIAVPTTVRRTVAFSPAVYQGHMQVEDVTGVLCDSVKVAEQEIQNGNIAIWWMKQHDVSMNFIQMWWLMPFWQNAILEQRSQMPPLWLVLDQDLLRGKTATAL